MALPPLDHFLSTVPAYGLDTALSEITETLGRSQAEALSHIVVTDDEHRPLGAIALGRLWANHYTWGLSDPGDSPSVPQLLDCQPWIEPVVEVEISQLLDAPALADLGALAQGTPAPTLVVIDAEGQYLGVLNPTRLLGWLATIASGASEAAIGTAWLEAEQKAWVLELSHTLKTPITTLLGLSTLLLDRRVGSLSDRQFRYVSLMRQAIRKLTSLVNLLLDWMRLESNQITLNLERVNLQPLLDDLLPSFHAQVEAVDATWVEEFTVRLLAPEGWVMADPLRLRQSLHYGLSYLLAHGVEPSDLVVERWGPWLGLTLGSPGFVPAAIGASPGDISATPQTPQTLQGLGLVLARQFSQLHGGEFSYLSSPAWGSRLTVLLPAPAATPVAATSPQTVLVLLASASESLVEQVYGCLRGTDYRLAIAPCCKTLTAMQGRLNPACILIHWESLPDAPTHAAARQALVVCLGRDKAVVLQAAGLRSPGQSAQAPAESPWGASGGKSLAIETLAQGLRPVLDQICQRHLPLLPGLTMLLLRSFGTTSGPSALSTSMQTWLQRYRCRLLQVDDLAQANLLSRVWRPQAIILDSVEPVSLAEFEALANYPDLARLPLVALVPGASEAAALALGLTLVPCLEVLSQPPSEAVRSLIQAIAMRQPASENSAK